MLSGEQLQVDFILVRQDQCGLGDADACRNLRSGLRRGLDRILRRQPVWQLCNVAENIISYYPLASPGLDTNNISVMRGSDFKGGFGSLQRADRVSLGNALAFPDVDRGNLGLDLIGVD